MSLKNKAVTGTLWTAGTSGVQAVIQILRLSILTRFLEKSDFGLVAIVTLILGFTNIFADMGVSVSLFSRKDISKKEYSSLYWIALLSGVLLYLILFMSKSVFANFYNLPLLNELIPVMGLDLIITTAGRQFRIFKQKALDFKSLALIDISAALLSLIVAFWVSQDGGGVWSIVYSTLCASLLSTFFLVLTGLKTHPLSLYINLREGKTFYKIGFYQTGSQILDYTASQLDILIIGKLMGPSELGIYNLIKQLILRILALLSPIINGVGIPLLAKFNHDMELLRDVYLKLIRISAFTSCAIFGVIALLSSEIITILYGITYESNHQILQYFCLWGSIYCVLGAASSIIVATGRTDLGFKWTVVRILTNPIFIIAGYQFGFLGIVIAQTVYVAIVYFLYWKLIISKINNHIRLNEYVLSLGRFFLCGFGLFIIFHLFKSLLGFDNIWLNSFVFCLLYLASFAGINREFFNILLSDYLYKKSK